MEVVHTEFMATLSAAISAGVAMSLAHTAEGSGAVLVTSDPTLILLESQLSSIRTFLQSLETQLAVSVPAAATGLKQGLDLALANVYNFAVFVRDDYDKRDDDVVQKNQLLQQTMSSFENLQKETDAVLSTLSKIHRDLNSNYQTILNALNDMRGKLESAQKAATATDIAVGILVPWWGIASLIDREAAASNVLGLQNAVNSLQDQVRGNQQMLGTEFQRLQTWQQTQRNLENSRAFQQSIDTQLSALATGCDAQIAKADKLQKILLDAKDKEVELVRMMGNLNNKATVTRHESLLKKEFVQGIFEICDVALMDHSQAAEIQMIVTEIENEYGSTGVASDLKTMIDGLKERLKRMEVTNAGK